MSVLLLEQVGATAVLPRAVGLARAKEIVFSARVVDANEALAIGLPQDVVSGDVRDAALAFAARFHAAPTAALGTVKNVMNHAFESDRRSVYPQEAMAQAICRESVFHQEAARRFLAKEAAQCQWPETPNPTT